MKELEGAEGEGAPSLQRRKGLTRREKRKGERVAGRVQNPSNAAAAAGPPREQLGGKKRVTSEVTHVEEKLPKRAKVDPRPMRNLKPAKPKTKFEELLEEDGYGGSTQAAFLAELALQKRLEKKLGKAAADANGPDGLLDGITARNNGTLPGLTQ
eukprot:gene23339-30588_t